MELMQRLKGGEDALLQRVWGRLLLSHSILERLRAQTGMLAGVNTLKIPPGLSDVALLTLLVVQIYLN